MGEWTLTPCICYYRLVNSTLKEKQWYIMGDWTLTPCKYHYRPVHCTIKEKQRYTMSEWTLTLYLYHYRHVDCKLKESERTLKPCMHHYKKCTLHFRRKATIEGVRLNTNFECFTEEMYTANGKKNNIRTKVTLMTTWMNEYWNIAEAFHKYTAHQKKRHNPH